MIKKYLLLIFSLFTLNFLYSQNFDVNGKVTLSGLTTFDSITVSFERTIPAYSKFQLITDTTGNYSISLPNGIYKITWL